MVVNGMDRGEGEMQPGLCHTEKGKGPKKGKKSKEEEEEEEEEEGEEEVRSSLHAWGLREQPSCYFWLLQGLVGWLVGCRRLPLGRPTSLRACNGDNN